MRSYFFSREEHRSAADLRCSVESIIRVVVPAGGLTTTVLQAELSDEKTCSYYSVHGQLTQSRFFFSSFWSTCRRMTLVTDLLLIWLRAIWWMHQLFGAMRNSGSVHAWIMDDRC
jgi:hypothetical protein